MHGQQNMIVTYLLCSA